MPSYATVAQLQSYLRDDTLDTAAAQLYLDIITSAVKSRCDQTLDLVSNEVVLLDPIVGHTSVSLPELPVVAISLVEIVDPSTLLWRTLLPTEWVFDPPTGIVSRAPTSLLSWPYAPQTVRVTYTHGYATIPYDLTSVTITAAARLAAIPVGQNFERIGQHQVKYVEGASGQWTPLEEQVLAQYRIPAVG